MKLRYKISLPSIIQAVIMIGLVSYIFIQGRLEMTNLKLNSNTANSIIEELHLVANNTDRFFLNEITEKEFEEKINSVVSKTASQRIFDGKTIINHLKEIALIVKKANELNGSNSKIVSSVMELTETAISQSMQYITSTATNLADSQKRKQVSTIERLVIIGATNNNMNNMRIQTLIYRMLRDFTVKDELLTFLDKAIENSTEDIERLKNTAFAGLPVAAAEASKKIKTLTQEYVKNVEQTNSLRQDIRKLTKNMLSELNSASSANMDRTFSSIYGLGILLITVLAIVTIAIVIVGLIMTRMVTKPLLELRNLVTNVVDNGDFSLQVENKQKDEIGETVNAFNQLMHSLKFAIAEINNIMSAIASGDFSNELENEQKGDLETLKNSINSTIRLLGQTIYQVHITSDKVNSGAQELSQSAQALASGTTEQAANLEEISSTTNVIDSQTRNNAEKANQSMQLTDQALQTVESGNEKMNDMLNSINKITQTSNDVAKVVKVIDEIAFQTNLLALNAAVEAARAGKFGKGFAVVAEEVRNLASRSAEAAKSTTDLIQTSVKEVENGVENSKQTADALAAINEVMTKIATLTEEIADASKDQTTGIDEINKGLTQINTVVQQNSSIAEETSSSSDELASQARELRERISQFKLSEKLSDVNLEVEGNTPPTLYLEHDHQLQQNRAVQPV